MLAMELPQQRERVTVDGLGNIGQGKYTGGSGKGSPVKVPPVGSKVTDKVTAEERRELLSRNKVDIADNAKSTEKASAVEETSGFKQAKTIEEAEKFALENGVRHVDYSDLPLETANLLNEAAMTLPEDIRPAYIGSGKSVQKVTGKKFSRKEKDYYGVHMDVLQMHFGEYPNIEYDFEGGNVVGISTAYKTPEKIHKSKVEGNKAYAEKHDGHTQFFNEDGRSTAFHEMGHIYADKKGVPEGFAEDAERWLKESKCDMLKSTDEAWAEAWGAYHTKNPDLPGYIAEYVENATNTPINNKSIDNGGKSGIIKSIDVDDYKLVTGGKGINPEINDVILTTMKQCEKDGGFVISEISDKVDFNENGGTPVLQIVPMPNGLLKLNVNVQYLSGKSLEEVNQAFVHTERNLAQSLKEAVIHESGHAISIKGKTAQEVDRLYQELKNQGKPGVSDIALSDGAELLAELEILRHRKTPVLKELSDFYEKYMGRKYL